MVYDFKKIEKKWQDKWEKKKVFHAKIDSKKKKYYVLEMFPYPSASGLHMGHAFNYTIGDIYARTKRMQGFNVLYPMGYDSFGLPAENAAIKVKVHPKKYTDNSIKNFISQQKSLGLSYDWSRVLKTSDPEYYKWNQFFFLKLLEKGLAYRKQSPVNWCSKCETVLANEQVHSGRCWRHTETEVEVKNLEQWFIKTTDYANELFEKIDGLSWPERIKTMQKNWIGKSHGLEIDFEINEKKWPIFTTRADTIYGVTFMVVSAGHPKLMEIVTSEQKSKVESFIKKIKSTKKEDIDKLEKEGVFTGCYAKHPLTGDKVPIWVGNFVLSDYGSGMVMAVPAHDQRDLEFAEKYGLGIVPVIQPKSDNREIFKSYGKAITTNGMMINSGKFDGMKSEEARDKIIEFLVKEKFARKATCYKLKDWLVSRQRYWGTPIPVVHCDGCGIQGVSEKDLPVLLPEKVKFGKGNPLETSKKFIETKCPKCKSKARRETDTMDTFFDSSWYYLRYCDNKNKKSPFDKKTAKYWMPVDQYIGGAEHATMHLIYARFFTKALRDLGFVEFDEPFKKLFNQGMLHGDDGVVMSKSRGNVVLPEEVSKKYGIDTARLFLVSIASPDKDIQWSDKGIEGSLRFIKRVIEFSENFESKKLSPLTQHKLNKAINDITSNIEKLEYNLAVIKLRDLFGYLEESCDKKSFEIFLKLLHSFCPHLTEELWERLGNKKFLSLEKWPVADNKKIDENIEKQEAMIEKIVGDIINILKIIGNKSKVYIYPIPNEAKIYSDFIGEIKKRTNLEVFVFASNDKDKYDPENKSNKVKPGKPGIYLE